MYKVRREFFITYIRTVLYMESRQDLAVFGYHLRRKIALRVFQFLERRDVGKHPHAEDQRRHKQYRGGEKHPEPFDYFLFSCILHNISPMHVTFR